MQCTLPSQATRHRRNFNTSVKIVFEDFVELLGELPGSCLTLEIIILELYFVCLRGTESISFFPPPPLLWKLEKHKLRFMLPSFTVVKAETTPQPRTTA